MVEVFGINDRIQLSYASKVMRKRINNKLMSEGVSMEDPTSTYISPDVKIDKDTVIFPNTTIMGKTTIGHGCEIGPNVIINNCTIGNNVKVITSSIENVTIKDNETVGPFEVRK